MRERGGMLLIWNNADEGMKESFFSPRYFPITAKRAHFCTVSLEMLISDKIFGGLILTAPVWFGCVCEGSTMERRGAAGETECVKRWTTTDYRCAPAV